MESFSARGGYWVVAQIVLAALYFFALVATPSVSEGLALGLARIVGMVTLAAGLVLIGWSAVLIGRHLTPFPRPADGAELIETGPYRIVRHPMYGGVILVAVGLALGMVNPWALLISLAVIVFLAAKVGHEEEMLSD